MLVTLLPIVTLVSEVHLLNAYSLILVTLSGIVYVIRSFPTGY